MAPASLASSTSRDSRPASLVISAGVRAFPSRTPPLITRNGFALAKSRRPFAVSTTSPVTNATADGPVSSGASSFSSPACSTAILVSVFFTTANVAASPRVPRSSRSCATLRPRYSVSTAPAEFWNRSVSSATAATFSAFAMGLLSRSGRPGKEERPGRGRSGAQPSSAMCWPGHGGSARFACVGRPLSRTFGRLASGCPATADGLWQQPGYQRRPAGRAGAGGVSWPLGPLPALRRRRGSCSGRPGCPGPSTWSW